MASYKNIRLEEHVYQELVKRQRPRESISQLVWRVLITLKKVAGHVDELDQILWKDQG